MDYLKIAKDVIAIEREALEHMAGNLDNSFGQAIQTIVKSKGKLVVSGMGKSGLIAKKMAATFASTGTPSFFVHPAEAYHGDLGMIEPSDVVLLISNSGETNEVLQLIAYLSENGNMIIAMSGKSDSSLAKHADFHLNIQVPQEACPLELAPTSSTTATLVMGDALAVALMEAKGFQVENFARFHPGGSLGRKLLTRVGDVMRIDSLPFISPEASSSDLVIKLSEGKLGLVIVGTSDQVLGVVTDGDLRRALLGSSFDSISPRSIMTKTPVFFDSSTKLQKVEACMVEKKIATVLIGSQSSLEGVYQIYS